MSHRHRVLPSGNQGLTPEQSFGFGAVFLAMFIIPIIAKAVGWA